MTDRTDYTIEIYRTDRRYKGGETLHGKYDYHDKTLTEMEAEVHDLSAKLYPSPKFRFEIHESWVMRTNLMTGKEFMERYDTPHYCSPSSETYFSM